MRDSTYSSPEHFTMHGSFYLVPRASRTGSCLQLCHPRHEQQPRPLVQRGVAGVPLLRQPPGRLNGRKSGGRDSRDQHKNDDDSSHLLGRHLGPEVEDEALLS